MKRTAHAYRHEAEPTLTRRPVPTIVAVDHRPEPTTEDSPSFQLIKERERFTIVMWDEA